MLTKPEMSFARELEKLGWVVQLFSDKTPCDPSNIAYMQVPLGQYVFDFSVPALGILFEIDGEHWHPSRFRLTSSQAQQGVHDKEKSDYAQQLGWIVVRIPAEKVVSAREQIRSLFFAKLESDGI